MTTAEAAQVLNLSPTTIRWAIRVGYLPATKRGREYVVELADVFAYRREHLGKLGRRPR